jgi:hypothetical protein
MKSNCQTLTKSNKQVYLKDSLDIHCYIQVYNKYDYHENFVEFSLFLLCDHRHQRENEFSVIFSNPDWNGNSCRTELAEMIGDVWSEYEEDMETSNRMLRGDRKLLCNASWCSDPAIFKSGVCSGICDSFNKEAGGTSDDLTRKMNQADVGSYGNLLSGKGKKTAKAVYDYAENVSNTNCKSMMLAMTYKVYE